MSKFLPKRESRRLGVIPVVVTALCVFALLLIGIFYKTGIVQKPALEESKKVIQEAYQKLGTKKAPVAYEYPVVPGTPEWEELRSGEEMYAATNLPEEILEQMDTETLVESILAHPLLFTSWITSDDSARKQGIERFSLSCTSVEELYKRQDAGIILAYRLMEYLEKPEQPGSAETCCEEEMIRFLLGEERVQEHLGRRVKKAIQVYLEEEGKGRIVPL